MKRVADCYWTELSRQKIIAGAPELAVELADAGELVEFAPGELLIQQDDETNDVLLLIAGVCDVVVNGRRVAKRSSGDHVGEMVAIQPTQRRSASVIAEDAVLAPEAFRAGILGRSGATSGNLPVYR